VQTQNSNLIILSILTMLTIMACQWLLITSLSLWAYCQLHPAMPVQFHQYQQGNSQIIPLQFKHSLVNILNEQDNNKKTVKEHEIFLQKSQKSLFLNMGHWTCKQENQHCVSKKWRQCFIFLNNSSQKWTDFNNFWYIESLRHFTSADYTFVLLTWIM